MYVWKKWPYLKYKIRLSIYLQSSGDDPLDKLLCCQGIFRVDNNKNPPLFRLFVGVAAVDIISNRRSPVTNNVDLIQNQSTKFG